MFGAEVKNLLGTHTSYNTVPEFLPWPCFQFQLLANAHPERQEVLVQINEFLPPNWEMDPDWFPGSAVTGFGGMSQQIWKHLLSLSLLLMLFLSLSPLTSSSFSLSPLYIIFVKKDRNIRLSLMTLDFAITSVI